MKKQISLILLSTLIATGCGTTTTSSSKESSNEESHEVSSNESSVVEESSEELESSEFISSSEKIESSEEIVSSEIESFDSEEESMEESTSTMSIDDCVTTEQIEKYKELGYEAVYKDPNYKDGYIVTHLTQEVYPYHYSKYLRIYPSLNNPSWTIAQWWAKYDIMGNPDTDPNAGYTLTRTQNGLVNTLTSKGKTVNDKFIPGKVITANSITGELYLEMNASVIYDKTRTGSEGWAHLLYSQEYGDNYVNLSSTDSLIMEADFTIEYCNNMIPEGEYNVNKHAAQLVWYITLQNRNRSSADYGKYIWFGIGLWDNRNEGQKAAMYRALDQGTGTLIYNPSSDNYYEDGIVPKIGERKTAKIDIRQIVEEAFIYAKNEGYYGKTEFSDLSIGGTNFGYELPGTFDIGTTIHAINVFAKYKK